MKSILVKIQHETMTSLTMIPDGEEFLGSFKINYKVLSYFEYYALVDVYECEKGLVDLAFISASDTVSIIGEFEHGIDINEPAKVISIDKTELINFMPDVIEYDSEGVEVSRERPTKAQIFHDWCDLSKRRL